MDINRFTEKAQEALAAAQRRATQAGHQQVDVEHLLAALLEDEQGLTPSILQKTGVNLSGLKRRLDQDLDRLPRVSGPSGGTDQVYVTGRLNRLLTQAEDEAKHEVDGRARQPGRCPANGRTRRRAADRWWRRSTLPRHAHPRPHEG